MFGRRRLPSQEARISLGVPRYPKTDRLVWTFAKDRNDERREAALFRARFFPRPLRRRVAVFRLCRFPSLFKPDDRPIRTTVFHDEIDTVEAIWIDHDFIFVEIIVGLSFKKDRRGGSQRRQHH